MCDRIACPPPPKRLRISELNPHLLCALCGGYLIDATTIIECLHSFCKTCILRYLETSTYCPICEVLIHKTRPWQNIRLDHSLQNAVYKMVPGLFQDEMRRRREFYEKQNLQDKRGHSRSQPQGEFGDRIIFSQDEEFSISIEFSPDGKPAKDVKENKSKSLKRTNANCQPDKRYLKCPAGLRVEHLKKFIRSKFSLPHSVEIDLFHEAEPLSETYSLMDVAYIYHWKRDCVLRLFYSFYEIPPKVRKVESVTKVTEKISNNRLKDQSEEKSERRDDDKKPKNKRERSKEKKQSKLSGKRKICAEGSTLVSDSAVMLAESLYAETSQAGSVKCNELKVAATASLCPAELIKLPDTSSKVDRNISNNLSAAKCSKKGHTTFQSPTKQKPPPESPPFSIIAHSSNKDSSKVPKSHNPKTSIKLLIKSSDIKDCKSPSSEFCSTKMDVKNENNDMPSKVKIKKYHNGDSGSITNSNLFENMRALTSSSEMKVKDRALFSDSYSSQFHNKAYNNNNTLREAEFLNCDTKANVNFVKMNTAPKADDLEDKNRIESQVTGGVVVKEDIQVHNASMSLGKLVDTKVEKCTGNSLQSKVDCDLGGKERGAADIKANKQETKVITKSINQSKSDCKAEIQSVKSSWNQGTTVIQDNAMTHSMQRSAHDVSGRTQDTNQNDIKFGQPELESDVDNLKENGIKSPNCDSKLIVVKTEPNNTTENTRKVCDSVNHTRSPQGVSDTKQITALPEKNIAKRALEDSNKHNSKQNKDAGIRAQSEPKGPFDTNLMTLPKTSVATSEILTVPQKKHNRVTIVTENPSVQSPIQMIQVQELSKTVSGVAGKEQYKTVSGIAGKEPSKTVGGVAGKEQSKTVSGVAGKEPSKTVSGVAGKEPSKTVSGVAGKEPSKTVSGIAGKEQSKTVSGIAGKEPSKTVSGIAGKEQLCSSNKNSLLAGVPVSLQSENQQQTSSPYSDMPVDVSKPMTSVITSEADSVTKTRVSLSEGNSASKSPFVSRVLTTTTSSSPLPAPPKLLKTMVISTAGSSSYTPTTYSVASIVSVPVFKPGSIPSASITAASQAPLTSPPAAATSAVPRSCEVTTTVPHKAALAVVCTTTLTKTSLAAPVTSSASATTSASSIDPGAKNAACPISERISISDSSSPVYHGTLPRSTNSSLHASITTTASQGSVTTSQGVVTSSQGSVTTSQGGVTSSQGSATTSQGSATTSTTTPSIVVPVTLSTTAFNLSPSTTVATSLALTLTSTAARTWCTDTAVNVANSFLNIPAKESSSLKNTQAKSNSRASDVSSYNMTLHKEAIKLDNFLFDTKPSETASLAATSNHKGKDSCTLVRQIQKGPLRTKSNSSAQAHGLMNSKALTSADSHITAVHQLPKTISHTSKSYSVAKFMSVSSAAATKCNSIIQTTKISTLIPKSSSVNSKAGTFSKSFSYPSTLNSVPSSRSFLHTSLPPHMPRPDLSAVINGSSGYERAMLNKAAGLSSSSSSVPVASAATTSSSHRASSKQSSKDGDSKTEKAQKNKAVPPLTIPKSCLTTLKLQRSPGSTDHYIFAPLSHYTAAAHHNGERSKSKEVKYNGSGTPTSAPTPTKDSVFIGDRQRVPTIKISDINRNPIIVESGGGNHGSSNSRNHAQFRSYNHGSSRSSSSDSGSARAHSRGGSDSNSPTGSSDRSDRSPARDARRPSDSELLLSQHWHGYSAADLLFNGFKLPSHPKFHDLHYDTDAMPLDYSQSSSKS